MRSLLAIIGQPGAGKTTALKYALYGVPRTMVLESVPPFVVYPGGAQLGLDRPGFAGSDAYPLNVQPKAIRWLVDAPYIAVVTEGDRLSNDAFFLAAKELGYDLTIAWIDTPDDVAALRRVRRGSRQDETWVRGRQTKVRGLIDRWSSMVVRIDGSGSVETVAGELAKLPVIKRLKNRNSRL